MATKVPTDDPRRWERRWIHAEAQTALRMLGREPALPFAPMQYGVDPTDQDRGALEIRRAAHPTPRR